MTDKQQRPLDRHLGTPAESNQDHHINFQKVEEESAGTLADFHYTDTERQKRWRQGVKEGHEAQEQSDDPGKSNISRSNDDDATLGQQ